MVLATGESLVTLMRVFGSSKSTKGESQIEDERRMGATNTDFKKFCYKGKYPNKTNRGYYSMFVC